MNRLVRAAALAFVASALSAAPAPAQAPPDPLPMGVPYLYQPGNPYWFRPLAYSPYPLYGYPSYYPFGATGPIYGRYSWDYDVYYAAGVGWYQSNMPAFPYQFRYPTYSYNYAWKGFGW
jgi:hypothetical protein